MREILSIDIIENDKGGHEDLLFSFPDLISDKAFDTYYFCLAIDPVDPISDIKNAVSQLLRFWLDKIEESNNGETIYLPIDFSDQYTGCLKVGNKNKQLVLTYGYSRREGYTVDPLNPENYYKSINDFHADTQKQLTIDKAVFTSVLDQQIRKLQT